MPIETGNPVRKSRRSLAIMPRGHQTPVFFGLCMPASSLPPHHHLGQHNAGTLDTTVVCGNSIRAVRCPLFQAIPMMEAAENRPGHGSKR
jgi:hypothetical protein